MVDPPIRLQLLRVAPPNATLIHLAAEAPGTRRGWTVRTLCGLPWRRPADDAAEVDAFLQGVASRRWPGRTVCPVCAREAIDQPAIGGTAPAHSSR